MVLQLSINKFEPIGDYCHKCTSWFIYEDKEMSKLLLQVEKSTKFLNYLIENVYVDRGRTVYVKVIRHLGFIDPKLPLDQQVFSSGDEQCGVVESTFESMDVKDEIARMLHKNDVVVEQPTISYNETEFLDVECGYVTFTTSTCRIKEDGHLYTHWYATDRFNNVIWTSMYDKQNKTSIKINKDELFKALTSIKVYAIHVSSNNICSPRGVVEIITGKQNFDIISSVSNILPGEDYELLLRKRSEDYNTGIVSIAVTNAEETEQLWGLHVTDKECTRFLLPWYLFKSAMSVILKITVFDQDNSCILVKRRLSTRDSKLFDITDRTESSELIIETLPFLDKEKIVDSVMTMQMFNRNVLLPNGKDDRLYEFNVDTKTGKLNNTGKWLDGVTIINNDTEDTLVRLTEDNYLVIDTLNENRKPTFLVYKIDKARRTYNLLHTLSREEEIYPLGRTGNFIQVTQQQFFYLPIGCDYICSYNYLTNRLVKIATIPLKGIKDFGSLVKLNNNRIMCIGAREHMTKVFLLNEIRFVDGISVRPESFLEQQLKAVQLNNGSTVLLKRMHVKEDTQIDMLFFDYVGSDFLRPVVKFKEGKLPNTTIELLNGSLLMCAGVDKTSFDSEGNKQTTYGTYLEIFR